jgi:hypothetical protein
MVHIEVGFTPDDYEKRMVEQTKEDVLQRLEGCDLGSVKIVLKRRSGSQMAFQFLGEAAAIEKAKQLLGIH